jgi:hypothetical protein
MAETENGTAVREFTLLGRAEKRRKTGANRPLFFYAKGK